jgi:transposase
MNTVTKIWIGVDVSKKRLDVSIYPIGKDFSVANDVDGIKNLIRKISNYQVVQMVCESSGYEILLLQMFLKNGLPTWSVEPSRIKAFIRSKGVHAKTDQSDARMMAQFANQNEKNYESVEITEQKLQLASLSKRREDLQGVIQAEKTRLSQTFDSLCKQSIEKSIAFLEQQISQISDTLQGLIDDDQVLQLKSNLLLSVPGVGNITTAKLIAELPELGIASDKQIAALVGLAPFTRQSGNWKGKSFIYGGRSGIRKILYMAALSASRCNIVLKEFYKKLRAAGKKPKVAIIAVARKLIVILNAIIRKSQLWSVATTQE